MKHLRSCAAFAILFTLAACGSDGEDYPNLLPTEAILAEPRLPDHATAATGSPAAVSTRTEDRADALRQRADTLRGPVIEPDARDRMRAAGG
ncbi:hypothetical protein JHW45_05850 [Paracoccus stylophorae]|uniref:Argininosuccinate lyase n=1 Tax=Paracoccus stylophorae TaxID=659350 RepID=A0ABY7SXW1_9RHOB|nr:hypothetical protein [Paracoccus stylophorae]WCR11885.1 hypothetical protein JHW45_05850 [Paracoccus stylophorae]